jgi:hypothetical protein
MSMTTLFTSIQQDLKSFLEELNTDGIRERIDKSTFYKGREYQESGRVEDIQYSGDRSRLSANVRGSLEYTVRLELHKRDVRASCSCPVDGLCKHIAAVLLYAVHNKGAVEVAQSRAPGSRVAEYLASLSKEELVALVIQYAPEEFFVAISNRYAGKEQALTIYHKVMAAIRKLFTSEELLYEPDAFEQALVKQLRRLLGLEQQLQQELSKLIFYIIQAVNDAFDEGYLYEDYSNAFFEEPEEFYRLVENYTRSLPYAERTRFLQELNSILNDLSYDTFDRLNKLGQDVFNESDLPAVKSMLLKNFQELSPSLAEQYYGLVRTVLTEPEKEKLLLYLKDINLRNWLPELIGLYRGQGREGDAIEVIRHSLSRLKEWYNYEPIFFLYLDLLKSQNMALDAACAKAIEHCPSSSMLEKVAEVTAGDTTRYEQMLEQKNPAELLDFLEKRGRLTEALSLLKRSKNIWDEHRYRFFKAHKKSFSEEALQYFYEVLDKHLQHTGNNHYYAIAETLQEIRQLDHARAAELVADIRANYYRRRNLMALIKGI